VSSKPELLIRWRDIISSYFIIISYFKMKFYLPIPTQSPSPIRLLGRPAFPHTSGSSEFPTSWASLEESGDYITGFCCAGLLVQQQPTLLCFSSMVSQPLSKIGEQRRHLDTPVVCILRQSLNTVTCWVYHATNNFTHIYSYTLKYN
jgi:hypothetical protein